MSVTHLGGGMLVWAIVWRGVIYGAVDGLLLVSFPWIVVWRAFEAREKGWGAKVGAVPTLVTANPVASPLSHVFLHVTAVIHSPETDLFLPPHRD